MEANSRAAALTPGGSSGKLGSSNCELESDRSLLLLLKMELVVEAAIYDVLPRWRRSRKRYTCRGGDGGSADPDADIDADADAAGEEVAGKPKPVDDSGVKLGPKVSPDSRSSPGKLGNGMSSDLPLELSLTVTPPARLSSKKASSSRIPSKSAIPNTAIPPRR